MTDTTDSGAPDRGNRELLMLPYYYPPADHAGTRRMTAFARYLPEVGYRPIILTTNIRGSTPSDAAQYIFRAGEISSLLARPYRALRLRRVPQQQRGNVAAIAADSWVSRMLMACLIPDLHVTWYPLAVRQGLRLLRSRPIKLLFSSSPPATSHLVALRLKRLTGLPWVADFRDGWMFEPPNPVPFNSRIRTRIEYALERQVVLSADRIVTVNQTIADDLARRYPATAGRIEVITNGYDPADVAQMPTRVARSARMRLVYTGSLALSRTGTSISGLLAALRGLREAQPALADEIELVFVGKLTDAEQRRIAETGLGDQVSMTGRLSHQDALRYQAEADALLLITVSGDSSVTTSKLFEYLASGRPILGLTGRSPAAEIIRDLDAGVVVDPDDVPGIRAALGDLHRRWRADDLPTRHDPRVTRFSRPHLTADLARCFDELLGG